MTGLRKWPARQGGLEGVGLGRGGEGFLNEIARRILLYWADWGMLEVLKIMCLDVDFCFSF